MATYNFDWEGIRDRALALEAEVAPGTELEAGIRQLYRETDGKLILDKALRDNFVSQVTHEIDRDKLENENHRLKDDRDRRMVAESVREAMGRVNVKPELMNAAVAMFIAQHKFAVRDGKVVVVGKAGASDAHSAAVQWADSGEVDSLLGKCSGDEGGGDFMQAVNRLKSVH